MTTYDPTTKPAPLVVPHTHRRRRPRYLRRRLRRILFGRASQAADGALWVLFGTGVVSLAVEIVRDHTL